MSTTSKLGVDPVLGHTGTRAGSVNPTTRHVEAALDARWRGGSLAFVSEWGRSSHEVSRLIGRISELMAERRRLASAAKRELTP